MYAFSLSLFLFSTEATDFLYLYAIFDPYFINLLILSFKVLKVDYYSFIIDIFVLGLLCLCSVTIVIQPYLHGDSIYVL